MSHLSLVGQDVYSDLEIFTSFSNDPTQSVMHMFTRHMSNRACHEIVKTKLKNPIFDIASLKERQHCLQEIIDTYDNNTELADKCTNNISNYEEDLLWLLDQNSSEVIDYLDIVYFKLFVFEKLQFNRSSILLSLMNTYTIVGAPLLGLVSPLMYFIIPYIILVYKLKFKVSIKTFIKTVFQTMMKSAVIKNLVLVQCLTYGVSLFIYIQSLLNTFELAKNTYKVSSHIVRRVSNVITYIEACEELNQIFKFNRHDNSKVVTEVINSKNVIDFGRKFVLFKYLNKTQLREYISISNTFLGDLTIARFYKSHNMCFATYVEDCQHTHITAKDMYHVCLDKYVTNDIVLEGNNAIITGPNAAGKSTFIKSIILNVLLSQTYGVANASHFELTPFYYINTQINIPDVKGKQSLFEAEMYRCKTNLDIANHLPPDRKALILMDEVFSSTNVVEGVAGAFGILHKLGSLSNICTIVTTHFLYLTKLKSFKKFKMNAQFDDEDTISYPYILEKGFSTQLVAIELIKNNFDKDVIDTALSIKNKLLV
ncbi:hypothetical protein QKU58_gp114 [Pyramimonas orientalis virus]|uniref:Uncharacterized protein n=2 Tax=Heliosvirus raunefjordenense TaxID=3060030 RepID=A0A7M3UNG4_9VIRU|nr:hypothetical protein QKU58_gp114 [Pyramimonas orientalis virus]QOI90217.1 hypothetical protein HWQ62_00080 [Pyramimonas orientalis virus]CBX20918.1 MutS protein [Pyramimonas orientalis virus]